VAKNPTGKFPATCAAFNQLGVRVPLTAVSPFSKLSYVSHTPGDHTSILAMIEKRFLPGVHLTRRDEFANDLEGMFNFDTSRSLNTPVGQAKHPEDDCTPTSLDRVEVR
jgi:phospholipase C